MSAISASSRLESLKKMIPDEQDDVRLIDLALTDISEAKSLIQSLESIPRYPVAIVDAKTKLDRAVLGLELLRNSEIRELRTLQQAVGQ